MNNMFFEREIYTKLEEWVMHFSGLALYLHGPRQVGKTSILSKLGEEKFERYVYINLYVEDMRVQFENNIAAHREKHGYAKSDEDYAPMWEEIFSGYDPSYINSPETLVVIDEIQESSVAYNNIRQIRRGLKSKLAITGSYLGVTNNFKGYKMPAGDIFRVEMSSMTFTEFLKANKVWDEYKPIETFDWAKMNKAEQNICERVRELYRVYCQIGGYPEVVYNWVTTNNVGLCQVVTAGLVESFYGESSEYFGEIIGHTLWKNTLERVASHMITKSGDLDVTIAKEMFRDDNTEGLGVRRRDKINALKWLDECCITGTVRVYDKLEKVASISNKLLFYFRDMGFLTQLGKNLVQILPSDLTGMLAENFVYLHLLKEAGHLFIEEDVCSFNGQHGQIDFVMHDQQRKRYGIEVKHNKGDTKSGDTALKEGQIDYLIRVQDTYGSVQAHQATVPIFMLDKLNSRLHYTKGFI